MKIEDNTPFRIIHWEDSVDTGATGWLVIDSLVNGVCGGGIFMHPHASLDEVKDLAHTMSLKNTLTQPQLGGAKAGVRFDPKHPEAEKVLQRFLQDHRFYIKNFWYTGADLNTDNKTIIKIIQDSLHLPSPFIALADAIKKALYITPHTDDVSTLISEPNNEFFQLYNSATGFSVAECVHFFAPFHPRIILQGFGAVGSAMAYFTQKYNWGDIVAICDHEGSIRDEKGIDIEAILREKQRKNITGTASLNQILSPEQKKKYNYKARDTDKSPEDYLCDFLKENKADAFTPCANRYALSSKTLHILAEHSFSDRLRTHHTPLIVSGANNAFPDMKAFETMKELNFLMPPEWVSNCGNAVLFVEAVKTQLQGKEWIQSAFESIHSSIRDAIEAARQQMREQPLHLYEAFLNIAEKKVKLPVLEKTANVNYPIQEERMEKQIW